MSPSGSNDDIIIRDFEPKDLDRVKYLFQAGMLSHVPTLTNLLTRHRLATPHMAHPLVLSAPVLALVVPQKQSRSSKDSVSYLAASSLLLYLGAALASSLGWFAYHSYLSPKLFSEYIEYSVNTDISDIPNVYQEKGGIFLVAVNKDTDMVLGMVGGEYKHKEVIAGSQRDVYEVRRLSVGPEARGKGLGRRLMEALQERVPAGSRLFADCSNIQPTAQRLYVKNGFGLTSQFPLKDWPGAFNIWRYEKEV